MLSHIPCATYYSIPKMIVPWFENASILKGDKGLGYKIQEAHDPRHPILKTSYIFIIF